MRTMGKFGWFCRLGLILATVATTALCNKPADDRHDTSTATAKDTANWYGFAAYPNARQLCSEHVLGLNGDRKSVEFEWVSYAATDATEKVIGFYSRKPGGKIETHGKSFEIRQSNDLFTLSVHRAAETGYPTCENKPRPDEKTVIVVSTLGGP